MRHCMQVQREDRCHTAPMAARLKKQLVVFPPPMGERVLHYVRLPDKPGPWLALDEACLKVFGVDSPIQAKSKETIRRAAQNLSSEEGELTICVDPGVKRLLVSAGVIGPQAVKFTMVSAQALETLVQIRGGGLHMLHPLKQLDNTELFEATFIGNTQPPSSTTGTTQNVQMQNRPLRRAPPRTSHMAVPTASLMRDSSEHVEESDSDSDYNATNEVETSSGNVSSGGLLHRAGQLAPGRSKQQLQHTSQAEALPLPGSTDSRSNGPERAERPSRLPVDTTPVQRNNTTRLPGRLQPIPTLIPSPVAPRHPSPGGGIRPRQFELSSPASRKRKLSYKSRPSPVRPRFPLHADINREMDDIEEDEDEEGLPCSDTEEFYDVDEDDEEAQLRRAFKAEARLVRQNRVPPSVRLDDSNEAQWSSSQLRSDYGLKENQMPPLLQQQLELLVDKLGSTNIEPLRRNVASQPLAQPTIVKFRKDVCRFLGFCRNIRGWGDPCLTLSAFSNTETFSDFLQFINARTRGDSMSKLNDMLTLTLVAIRVNHFMANLLARYSDYSLLAADNSPNRAIQYLGDIRVELRMLKRREAGSNVRCVSPGC